MGTSWPVQCASWAAISWVAFGGFGCGDDGAAEDGGASDVTEARVDLVTYCQARANAYFAHLDACFGPDVVGAERSDELEALRMRCELAADAIAAGRLSYDPEAAARCLAEQPRTDCAMDVDPPACREVFEGLVEPGGTCFSGESRVFTVGVSACRDGACVEDGECPGTCTALPTTGEPCPDGTCRETDVCIGGVCRVLPGPGEPCASSACASDAACVEGTCRRLAANADEPCGDEVVCRGPITVCVEGRCRSRVELGDPCRLPIQCPAASVCREGTCQDRATSGEGCGSDRDCADALFCRFGEPRTCEPIPAIGEPCPDGRCAEDATCFTDDTGTNRCRARVGAGESCAESFDLCPVGTYCTAELVCDGEGARGESCWAVRPCEAGLGCHCTARDVTECTTSQQDDGDTCEPLVADGGPCFVFSECESRDCDLEASSGPTDPGVCRRMVDVACLP